MSNTQFVVSMKFQGQDLVSADIQKINENMKNLGTPIKQIDTQAKQAQKSLNALGKGPSGGYKWLDDMSNGLQKASDLIDKMNSKFEKMKSSGFSDMATGGALLAPVATAINKAGDFQLGMTTIDMSSGATQAQDAAIQKAIRDSSTVTKFTTSEVEDIAIKEATSGMNANQVIQLTPEMTKFAEVQNLGKGTGTDESVTDAISSAHMFGIYDPKNLDTFLNKFNKATFMSPGSTSEYFDTLKYLAPKAQAMQMSQDDILYTSALANRVGFLGSMGGTDASDMILRSIPGMFGGLGTTDSKGRFKPSKQLKAMTDLGLASNDGSSSFFDSNGKFKGMENFIDQLAVASKKVNPEQFAKDLHSMFGAQGMPLADLFSERGGEQLQTIKKQRDNMKSIDDFQAAYNKDFKQQLEQFESNVGNFAAKIGTDLLPSATNFLTKLEDGVAVASDWVDSHKQEVETIGKVTAAVGGALLAIGAAKIAIGGIGTLLSPLTGTVKGVINSLNSIVVKPLANTYGAKAKQAAADAASVEKNLTANVVNVYGKEINGGSGGIGGNIGGGSGEESGGWSKKSSAKGEAGAVITGAEDAAAVATKSGLLSKTGSLLKGVGAKTGTALLEGGKSALKGLKVAAPLAVIAGIADVMTAPQGTKLETASKDAGGVMGGWAGAEAGAAMGATLGSVVPGIGTAVGGLLGAAIGGIAGDKLGEYLTGSLYKWVSGINANPPAIQTQASVFSPIQQKVPSRDDILSAGNYSAPQPSINNNLQVDLHVAQSQGNFDKYSYRLGQ